MPWAASTVRAGPAVGSPSDERGQVATVDGEGTVRGGGGHAADDASRGLGPRIRARLTVRASRFW